MKSIALFPGSFDPPTKGHVGLIRRAVTLVDQLVVAVAYNSDKKFGFFTPDERVKMLKSITHEFDNVEIATFQGLVVDFAEERKANFLIRGLRALSDVDFEFQMALANRRMTGIETIFLMADQELLHISSTLIRDIGGNGRRLHEFVPEVVEEAVFRRLSNRAKT